MLHHYRTTGHGGGIAMLYLSNLAISEVTLHSVNDFFEALVVKHHRLRTYEYCYTVPPAFIIGTWRACQHLLRPVIGFFGWGTFFSGWTDAMQRLKLCRVDFTMSVLIFNWRICCSRITWCNTSEALHMLLVIYWTSSSLLIGQCSLYCRQSSTWAFQITNSFWLTSPSAAWNHLAERFSTARSRPLTLSSLATCFAHNLLSGRHQLTSISM